MNRHDVGENLAALVPQGLDGVITRNRDAASLRLASAQEIASLERTIGRGRPVKEDLDDWRFITYAVPGKRLLHVHLLGYNDQGPRMTSAVTGIDLPGGLVATHSGSVYRLIGEMGKGEPDKFQIMNICAVFHAWGRGEILGVPRFW